MEYGLKAIDRHCPCEIEQTSERFGEVPRDDHAVRKFLHMTGTGEPRLEEHTDEGGFVDEFNRYVR